MRAAPSTVAVRMIIGLSVAGVAATLGCSGRPESTSVIDPAAASAARAEQEQREKGEEASCCARHFPGDRRLREACLSDAAHHQGVCAPRCAPPRDVCGTGGGSGGASGGTSGGSGGASGGTGGGSGGATGGMGGGSGGATGGAGGGSADASVGHDAAPPDASLGRDAAQFDASGSHDAAPVDASGAPDAGHVDAAAGNDVSDSSVPVICPTNVVVDVSESLDAEFSHHERFALTARTSTGQTVTWSASGTPGIQFFVVGGSGPNATVDCGAEGPIDVTATIVGPGSCVLTETSHLTCRAYCGNGIVGPGEQCDPPNGVTCDQKCQIGPAPTCGDGILEPGEACDVVKSKMCNLCEVTVCGQCVTNMLGSGDICRSTDGTQKIACQALEECMAFTGAQWCVVPESPTFRCFCADATCSTGPAGPCGRALQAYIGTTDQTALVSAANSTDMTQLILAMSQTLACGFTCSQQQ